MPVMPHGDYEIKAQWEPKNESSGVIFLLPYSDRMASLDILGKVRCAGLGDLNGVKSHINETKTTVNLTGGTIYEVFARVRFRDQRVHVQAKLDDQTIIDWEGKSAELNHHGYEPPNPPSMGIAVNYEPSVIHSLKLKMLSGQAKALRPATTVAETSPHTVDLLRLVDPPSGTAAGTWQLSDRTLVADTTPAARISLPYYPPQEYDYIVEFTVSRPTGCTALLMSRAGVPFTWSMNAGNPPRCRLEDIDGHSVIGNPCLRKYIFDPSKRHVCVVRVRTDAVTCRPRRAAPAADNSDAAKRDPMGCHSARRPFRHPSTLLRRCIP